MCIDKDEDGDGQNIFVKLTDFGFSCLFRKDQKLDLNLGTPLYMAPELVRDEEYDEKVDVWSMGVLVYVLFSGFHPFKLKASDSIETIS